VCSFNVRRDLVITLCSGLFLLVLINTSYASGEEVLRDPTIPLGMYFSESQRLQLSLQAVIIRGGRKEAIVNDQKVREGDRLGRATIVEISAGQLVYEMDNKFVVLTLRELLVEK